MPAGMDLIMPVVSISVGVVLHTPTFFDEVVHESAVAAVTPTELCVNTLC